MTLEELRENDLIVFECISGSRAYGLATPESDEDIKGVFVLPQDDFYGLQYVDQVSNSTNDIVYYELKRFMELLSKSNPGALELLYSPEDTIVKMHPIFTKLRSEKFLSKQCKETFGGYAMTQVRKAKGLNKKILNPVSKERKSILEFCFVAYKQGAIPISKYLELNDLLPEKCGLAKVSHMQEIYGLYYGQREYKGLVNKEDANDVALSSIPKGEQPRTLMSFNKTEYSRHCKEHKEYWGWVNKRNDSRYQNTIAHGKNYDTKNMMHTFRLLRMCEEIGREGKVNVRRSDRDYLLDIKRGAFEYEDLLEMAQQKIEEVEEVYKNSDLPETIDINRVNDWLVQLRREFYEG